MILLMGGCLWGGQIQFDNHYFTVMNSALTAPHAEDGFGFLKTKAEALCLLEKTAFNVDGISNSVRLRVTLSALDTVSRYTRAACQSPETLMGFITSSNLALSLSLLDESSKVLEQIPIPTVFLNIGAPGVPVSGMDPSGVHDPKVREEYERRIAENHRNTEVATLHYQVEQGINELKGSITSVIITAHLQKRDEPFKELIINSSLPESTKDVFLKTLRQP
jgi:hypothetical protein